jgi:hypothetical protein
MEWVVRRGVAGMPEIWCEYELIVGKMFKNDQSNINHQPNNIAIIT